MAGPRSYSDDIAPYPHSLTVKRWAPEFGAHECICDDGQRVFVDLFVNGDIPEGVAREDLVGKTVEVEYTHGFLWLAQGVRVSPASSPEVRHDL